ncbi:MAG TPA: hypothetical protein PK186_04490 [candidate division Zixibacteria bacterium]|nr:hypothetical protein [candidate division Zixibacteria bacterium]MDD4917267.1 hypothetical protein [candidate division Zixibacteria bacterium]MDM7973469.1 hypothetical protein [candidate division Zixibacteria bacterium]HOD67182.1 hypothetical protein [candidate division Zixibacteria bacterium]HPM36803.1 hypothetical protein [candidate division Zixibacteria bacterium]
MTDGHRLLCRRALAALGIVLTIATAHGQSDTTRQVRPRGPRQTAAVNRIYLTAVHRDNNLALAVTNRGFIGAVEYNNEPPRDAFTGWDIRTSCEFPAQSWRIYLEGLELWIGGRTRYGLRLSGGSQAGVFLPSNPPGEIIARSTTDRHGGPHPDAVSEEDFICEYTDTLMYREGAGGDEDIVRNPEPLNVKVTQESYAWTYESVRDVVFFNLRVENIGRDGLREVYIGLHVIPTARYNNTRPCNDSGEVVGFFETYEAPIGCGFRDTLNLAWHADRDGNAYGGVFYDRPVGTQVDIADTMCMLASVRSGLGIVPLRGPVDRGGVYYNWWTSRWAPSLGPIFMEPSADPSVRSFGRGSWWYNQDWFYSLESEYRRLSTHEQDHPNYWTGEIARALTPPWNPVPLTEANAIASNTTPDYLVSWGPLTLAAGHKVTLSFAVVGGELIHKDPWILAYIPRRPAEYEQRLDFSDLIANARWAQRVFDNPGFDTDGDGYAGEFRVCVQDSALVGGQWVAQKADTQWYKGDGIPDFRVAYPPPPPPFWLTPVPGGVHVRFNGQVSETQVDPLLQAPDFEGYRIYLGRDERAEALTVVGSFDRRNYDKWVKKPDGWGGHIWDLEGMPYSQEELRCLYAFGPDPCHDTSFHPEDYTILSNYRHPLFPNDSIFRFEPHGYNASEFDTTCGSDTLCTAVRKVYPEMPDPRTLPVDSITPEMFTAEGYFKFYEYEFTIEHLLPTVAYWVNVTAYDVGSPGAGVYPLESDKTAGLKIVYPTTVWDSPLGQNGKVYVYPNPYRTDAGYREQGLEGRNQNDRWDERVRAVWFANLPPVCVIKVFTLDGDLVRELRHEYAGDDPEGKRAKWGLINKNQQLVETGLYYWTVETPDGKVQMGKLAVLR